MSDAKRGYKLRAHRREGGGYDCIYGKGAKQQRAIILEQPIADGMVGHIFIINAPNWICNRQFGRKGELMEIIEAEARSRYAGETVPDAVGEPTAIIESDTIRATVPAVAPEPVSAAIVSSGVRLVDAIEEIVAHAQRNHTLHYPGHPETWQPPYAALQTWLQSDYCDVHHDGDMLGRQEFRALRVLASPAKEPTP